jgi:purine-nucleoside phosphorylase
VGLSGLSHVLPVEGAPPVETTHEEVLEAGRMLVPRLEAILRGVLREI